MTHRVDPQMCGKAVALATAYVVVINLEVVETGLSEANDPLMARSFGNPIERETRGSTLRMQSGARPHVCVMLGNSYDWIMGFGVDADAEEPVYAGRARRR